MKRLLIFLAALVLLGCRAETVIKSAAAPPQHATATFAGGCFWCMQPPFERLKGVISVTSGYTGGRVDKPSYEEVSAGSTGHREAVEVFYDPKQISYQQLLDVYWHNVDRSITPDSSATRAASIERRSLFTMTSRNALRRHRSRRSE